MSCVQENLPANQQRWVSRGSCALGDGNAGYELSWFANPSPPDYWDKIVLEHGYSRCTANQTILTCEVTPQHNIAANVDCTMKLVSGV